MIQSLENIAEICKINTSHILVINVIAYCQNSYCISHITTIRSYPSIEICKECKNMICWRCKSNNKNECVCCKINKENVDNFKMKTKGYRCKKCHETGELNMCHNCNKIMYYCYTKCKNSECGNYMGMICKSCIN